LDVDKVDLVVGPYSTVQTAPAMATVIEHGKVIIGLSAININGQFHYPKYFAMTNAGPRPERRVLGGFSRGGDETDAETPDDCLLAPITNFRRTCLPRPARTPPGGVEDRL